MLFIGARDEKSRGACLAGSLCPSGTSHWPSVTHLHVTQRVNISPKIVLLDQNERQRTSNSLQVQIWETILFLGTTQNHDMP